VSYYIRREAAKAARLASVRASSSEILLDAMTYSSRLVQNKHVPTQNP
jgi:hypothetical protein